MQLIVITYFASEHITNMKLLTGYFILVSNIKSFKVISIVYLKLKC